MQAPVIFGALLTFLAMAMPAAGHEPALARPVMHDELTRTLDELAGQLHDLGSRWREHFIPREQGGERPLITIMLGHRDQLGLSSEQVQTLERLRSDFQRVAIRSDADIRVAEMDLTRLLEADPVNLGQVEAKVREIERLRADLRLARIRAIEQGKAQLTPDQREKLRALLAGPRLRTGTPRPPVGERF